MLRQIYPATTNAVPVARRAVTRHASRLGASRSTTDAIALAVTEALTNVVLHAYRDDRETGDVAVEMELVRHVKTIVVRVIDHGLGLVPRLDSPGLGLGLPIIGQLADEVNLRSHEHGGTEVAMRFSLHRG